VLPGALARERRGIRFQDVLASDVGGDQLCFVERVGEQALLVLENLAVGVDPIADPRQLPGVGTLADESRPSSSGDRLEAHIHALQARAAAWDSTIGDEVEEQESMSH